MLQPLLGLILLDFPDSIVTEILGLVLLFAGENLADALVQGRYVRSRRLHRPAIQRLKPGNPVLSRVGVGITGIGITGVLSLLVPPDAVDLPPMRPPTLDRLLCALDL